MIKSQVSLLGCTAIMNTAIFRTLLHMNSLTILLIEFTTFIAIWAVITKLYIWPQIVKLPVASSLQFILLLHCGRVIGLTSLVPGIVSTQLPSGFSLPQAYGDQVAVVLALLALIALRRQWQARNQFVWLFNIIGFADFFLAITNAVRYDVFAQLGAYWIVPVFLVPPLIVSHIVIVFLLLRRKHST